MRNGVLLLNASLVLFLVANNRIIESKYPYLYSRIWQKLYSDLPYIRFVYSRITEETKKKIDNTKHTLKLSRGCLSSLTSADHRHLSSMRDMQCAISSTPIFQTTISRILSRMVPNTLQIRRTPSVSCSNHPVRISCITSQNKQLSSRSSQNCLITLSAGTAISGICAITKRINLFRNRSLFNLLHLLMVETGLARLHYCQAGSKLEIY